jgi:hypothetical protein
MGKERCKRIRNKSAGDIEEAAIRFSEFYFLKTNLFPLVLCFIYCRDSNKNF